MAKGEPKQVIVVRKDLNMRMGKVAAQSAHASMGALLNYSNRMYEGQLCINVESQPVREWLEGRFTKVCVYVNSEAELFEIYQKAIDAKVNAKIIQDAGLTEFKGIPTYTCLALGPDYPENIDPLTGHLKLL